MVRSVGSGGSVAVGLVFGRIVARMGQKNLYLVALSVMGILMFAIPLVGTSLAPVAVVMFSFGTVYGLLGPLYPLTTATYSSQEQRGVAMAYVGLYWGVAQIAVPASFGFIAANIGLKDSFWLAGVMFITFAIAMVILFPLLTGSYRSE